MIYWKNGNTLEKHLEKHVLNIKADNKKEQEKWKKKFINIDKYIKISDRSSLLKEYEEISINNTMDTNHYLFKDTSNNVSINFYEYDNKIKSELTTCTQYDNKDKNLQIHSCFFKDNRINNLDIFYFVNNIQTFNENLEKVISKDCRIYRKDQLLNEICVEALLNSNINAPIDDLKTKTTRFKINIIIGYLDKYIYKTDSNDILYNILINVLKYCLGDKYNVPSDNHIDFLINECNKINDVQKNKDVYVIEKDYFDLYIEMLNMCVYFINNIKNSNYNYINIHNSNWKQLFMDFRNY